MSHEGEITYLESIKVSNNESIANNTASIDAYTSAISSLQSQIGSYQQLQIDLAAENAQLTADNVTIDNIIALLV